MTTLGFLPQLLFIGIFLLGSCLATVSDPNNAFTVTGCPLVPVIYEFIGTGFANAANVETWSVPSATTLVGTIDTVTYPIVSGRQTYYHADTSYTITYTWQNSNGIQATCQFILRIQQPNIFTINSCPPSNLNVDHATGVTTWTIPTATSIKGSILATDTTHLSGVTFPVGDTTVSYTWPDAAGNYGRCEFTVTVVVFTIANCPPSDLFVNHATGIVTWSTPTATSNRGTVILLSAPPTSGSNFIVGNTTVSYFWADEVGNSERCDFVVTRHVVTINDCPSDMSVSDASTAVTWTAPTASSSTVTTLPSVSATHNPGGTFSVDTTVTYSWQDESNFFGSCSFTVTVQAATDNMTDAPTTMAMAVDPCDSTPCTNGVCMPDSGATDGYTCNCTGTGFEGTLCETELPTCQDNPYPCLNSGTCNNVQNGGITCTCADGYTGDDCGTNINECSTSPCINGGTCTVTDNGYQCACTSGYTGDTCAAVMSCADDTCSNGGMCIIANNTSSCNCLEGYTGDFCGMNIDDCDPDPCLNGGQCLDGVNEYTCDCADTGFMGDICETDINECDTDDPCVNGDCVNTNGSYECTCYSGWQGMNCDRDIDECTNTSLCQNGATCNNFNGTYNCTCAPGYEGRNCETDTDECASNPCQNGGTCTDKVNGYMCTCTGTGYEGETCEIDIDECMDNTDNCDINAECINEIPFFNCSCNDGYEGDGFEGNCQMCTEGSYGNQCEGICTCVEYSASVTCNRTNGLCSCAPAFGGAVCDKADLSVELTVIEPVKTTVVQGDDLTLKCQVNLDSSELTPTTVTWTDAMGSNPPGSILGNGDYRLTITNVNPSDHKGTYFCNATTMLQNEMELTVSEEIFIDVIAPGEISDTSEPARIPLEGTASINCTSYGNPPPSLTWTRVRDNKKLNNGDENNRILIRAVNETGTLYQTSVLSISDIVRMDNGDYVCSARNDKGGDNETVQILVLESPLIEIGTLVAQDEATIQVSWTVTFTGNLLLDVCTVEYQQQGLPEWVLSTDSAVGEDLMYDITGLMPYTYYSARVTCSNEIGESNTETGGPERTRPFTPGPPRHVESDSPEQTSIRLQWVEPVVKNGPIDKYRIELESENGNKMEDTPNNEATVDGLVAGTDYSVYVRAINLDGNVELVGDRSNVSTFTTNPDAPTAPRDVDVDNGDTICTLTWIEPETPNGVITEYKIYPVSQGRGDDPGDPVDEVPITIEDLSSLRYVIEKSTLTAFSKYDYTMTASTSFGEGTKSSVAKSCDTPAGAPEEPPAEPRLPEEGNKDATTPTTFKMILSPASQRNGQVGCYEVVVIPLEKGKEREFDPSGNADDMYPPDEIPDYEENKGKPGFAYTAMVIAGTNLTEGKEITIGDKSSSFCDDNNVGSSTSRRRKRAVDSEQRTAMNGALRPEVTYSAFTRAYVPVGEGSQSDFSSSAFMEPVKLPATPGPSGGVVAVAIIIPILLIVVLVLLFFIWRRRENDKQQQDPLTRTDGGGEMKHLRGIDNPAGMQSDIVSVPPTAVDRMEAEYLRKKANNNAIFQAEYKTIPESTGNVTKEASLNEINKEKNRYINIIAYDQTRVRLQQIDDVPGTDYINACYVDGYDHPAKFIASQGPRDDTVDDFWRMVWEQNSTCIVMLTKCFEHGKDKCAQYWPDSGSAVYGDLTVTMEDVVTCSDYVIRKISMAEKGDEEGIHARSVTQFHFLGWPDFGIPEYPYSMLAFLKRVRQMTYAKADKGNIVIHCSAGVGRTGTYILIDTMMQMMVKEKKVDIYNFIMKIRSQRNLLVQSIVQYIFIHRALVEEYKYGHTEVDLMNLTTYYLKLTKVDSETQKAGVDLEYKSVASQLVEKTEQDVGNKEANKEKNRLRQVVPFDRNRVKLERLIGVEHSDYINASFIDGYEQLRAYIATQGPLPNTVSDFWRMVWEEQCSTIVMLSKVNEKGQEVCHKYWPDEGESATESYLAIQHVKEDDQREYIVRDFQLSNTKGGGLRNIRMYHFQDWPEVGMPETGVGIIKLIGEAQKHQKAISKFPIIVHCSSGAGRTGVFCALAILLGRIQAEGVVDVFQTVRTLRQQRPHMVQDPTQYQFCYKAILNHLDSYDTYANYK